MPDFNFKAGSFPIASIVDAAQRKAQLEQQNRTEGNQQLLAGLQSIGQVGQSLVDKRMKVAQALALKNTLLPKMSDDMAKNMEPEQILKAATIQSGSGSPLYYLMGMHPELLKDPSFLAAMSSNGSSQPPPIVPATGSQPAPAQSQPSAPANGAILASDVTQTPVQTPTPAIGLTPVPIAAPPSNPIGSFLNTPMTKGQMASMQMGQKNRMQPVVTRETALNQGGVQPGTHILSDEKGPQDVLDPKYQDKLEKQYTDLKSKFMSSRSGGAGLENLKVDQAIHLRKAINQYYDQKTGEYSIPPSLHSEFVIGLARLMSPNGVVAQQTMDDLRQRTAREGAANVLISLGFDPKQVGGTTQSVAKFFVEQIDRQGETSEENRNGYMDYIRGQAPSNLDPTRIAKHDKVGLNSFVDLLNKSPDRKSSAHPAGWNDENEQRLQMLLEKQSKGSLKS